MEEEFGSWVEADAGGATGPIRVLHVDDDPDLLEITSLLLERKADALEVVTENSAAAAIERLSAESVDCIVSDYQMPGQHGLGLFESLPEEATELPFILFTGKGSEEIASDAFSLGVTDYLQKETGTDQYTVLANRIEQAVSQHRSQRLLELTQRRFRTLVEEANDAILVVNSAGTILYATSATRHILGKTPDELVGTNGFDPIHPDDTTAVSEELESLLADPEYRARVEFRYQHADGSWIWVEIGGRNLLDNDDIAGIVVYIRDVDERKAKELELERRERMFEAVFRASSDTVVVADEDGSIVAVNPAGCDLFGAEKDELIGQNIQEFVPADGGSDGAWQGTHESGSGAGPFQVVGEDGGRRTVEFASTDDVFPDRQLTVLRDVSERSETDDE